MEEGEREKALTFSIFLIFFLFPVYSFSFINIESLRQNLKTGFYGSSGASIMGSSGNIKIFRGDINSQNILKKEKHETILIAKYKYGEASGVTNIDMGHIHLRYARGISESWQWEVFSQVEFNHFQSLSLRRLAGGGLRSKLYGSDQTSLFLGLGTFYEKEDIKNDLNQENFRGNIYVSFRYFFEKNFEIVNISYFQPSYKKVDDYRVLTSLGFEFYFTKNLSWLNMIKYSMDTRPPRGVQKRDISFTVGFNIEY